MQRCWATSTLRPMCQPGRDFEAFLLGSELHLRAYQPPCLLPQWEVAQETWSPENAARAACDRTPGVSMAAKSTASAGRAAKADR